MWWYRSLTQVYATETIFALSLCYVKCHSFGFSCTVFGLVPKFTVIAKQILLTIDYGCDSVEFYQNV